MIAIKNLTKIYQTKKTNLVTGVDDLSIQFPNNGVVFLLGKSGSGKSTLLNLIGGLDKPTSGEIIINGKSSKDFSNVDFDNYRNTYVGFVFQEYNIIEELNVKDNIALALRLQDKKNDNQEVEKVLKQVDLEGLMNRDVSELSGGQRQRVSIARALIKNPYLILADEPTGALDSQTGESIFKLLKELSKDRLIIVASHDRESAKKYGDRIIELKDGRILSDSTPKNNIELTSNSVELKKSALPMSAAVKIGTSNFKRKKIKFALSILLSATSLTMLGVASSFVLYDQVLPMSKALSRENYDALRVKKVIDYENKTYVSDEYTESFYDSHTTSKTSKRTLFTANDLNDLNKKGIEGIGLFKYPWCSSDDQSIECKEYSPRSSFYNPNEDGFLGFSDCGEEYANNNFTLLQGAFPKTSKEIAITEFIADGFLDTRIDGVNPYENYNSLLGSTVNFAQESNNYYSYTISGIYKTGEIPSRFNSLKTFPGDQDQQLMAEWREYLSNSFMNIILVDNSFYDENIGCYDYDKNQIESISFENGAITLLQQVKQGMFSPVAQSEFKVKDLIPLEIYKNNKTDFIVNSFSGEEIPDLKENEILISFDTCRQLDTLKYRILLANINAFKDKNYGAYRALKNYSQEVKNKFALKEFTDEVNRITVLVGEYKTETELKELETLYQKINAYINENFSELANRDLAFYSLKNETFYDSSYSSPVDELTSNLFAKYISGDDLNFLKESFSSSSEPTEISDGDWNRLDRIFSSTFNKTIGLKNAIVDFSDYYESDYMPAIEREAPEVASYIKAVTNKYPTFMDLFNAAKNDTASEEDLNKVYNLAVGINRTNSSIKKYEYGHPLMMLEMPEEIVATYESENVQKQTVKVVGSFSGKSKQYEHAIIASPKTLKNLKLSVAVGSQFEISNYKYEYTNEGKYLTLLTKPYASMTKLRAVNSRYGNYYLQSEGKIAERVREVSDEINMFKIIFNVAGAVLCVFSALLILNFISDSVHNKEKEIGILRSLGARKTDVCKIFFIETLILGTISSILSIAISSILVNFIRFDGLNVQTLGFGFFNILSLLFIGLGVSIVAAIVPIVKICNKSPIASIKSIN